MTADVATLCSHRTSCGLLDIMCVQMAAHITLDQVCATRGGWKLSIQQVFMPDDIETAALTLKGA